METVFRYLAPPSRCGYLPDQVWRLEYEQVSAMTAAEYLERMRQGWRRFGGMLFRPRCPACTACRSLRVVVDRFQPDRSQRRNRKLNEREVEVHIGTPSVTRAKLELYDRYHAFQTDFKDWPEHEPKDPEEYRRSFVENPFATLEWCYTIGDRLVGVGYVDDLPGGLSAIYFFYDPEERERGLGTWNVLSVIEYARQRGIPHVYLGYYVADCRSMAYKARFGPNQLRDGDGVWRDFR
ncbi:MAG: arginyltransferase [Planctomycetia bacterium]|nr:arginyltransferase [Planctomycetia bacterium]